MTIYNNIDEFNNMNKIKTRDRSVNFTREETERLVELIERRKRIIENKKSDAVTWQEKENAWKEIELKFNSVLGAVSRSAKHLKLKYEALKRDTRKKASIIQAKRNNNDASSPFPLSAIEERILGIILYSVEGEENPYDSDQFNYSDMSTIQDAFIDKYEDPVDIKTEDISSAVEVNDTSNNQEPTLKIRCLNEEWNEEPASNTANGNFEYKPTSLRPNISESKERGPFEKLAEEEISTLLLQRSILEEENQQKTIEKRILLEKLKFKREKHKLKMEKLRLEIELLKKQLRD